MNRLNNIASATTMIMKIELEDIDLTEIIFQLRKNARQYAAHQQHRACEKCSLIAYRREMQYRAQQKCDNQESQEEPIE